MRIDDGGSIANYLPKITFGSKLKDVYLLDGKLYNVTSAQVNDGSFDSILDTLDMTGAEFLTNATVINIPVMFGTVADGIVDSATDEDDILTKAAALYAETAGTNGIQNRTIVPFVFHAPGAGKYGNKVNLVFNDVFSIRGILIKLKFLIQLPIT